MHLVLSRSKETLKLFAEGGLLLMQCEARNRTVNTGFRHWGNCPSGEFVALAPVETDAPAFGHWFVPLRDAPRHNAFAKAGRRGIGLHGGGTGLKDPMAPCQGWRITHGCFRLANEDLSRLVELIAPAFPAREAVRVTVTD